jgi:hypothetical protein
VLVVLVAEPTAVGTAQRDVERDRRAGGEDVVDDDLVDVEHLLVRDPGASVVDVHLGGVGEVTSLEPRPRDRLGGRVGGHDLGRHPRIDVRRDQRIRHARGDLTAQGQVVLFDPVLEQAAAVPPVQADPPPTGQGPPARRRHRGVLAEVHREAIAVQHELVHDQPEPGGELEDLLDAGRIPRVARQVPPEAVHDVVGIHEVVVERLVVRVRVVDAVRAHQ